MPKPARIIRPVAFKIYLPEDLAAQVNLGLFSGVEGRIPHGRLSQYFERLVREDFARRSAIQEAIP